MNRFFRYFIVVAAILSLLCSCRQGGGDNMQPSSNLKTGPELFGSGDGAGGGNTCKGKPIENYKIPDVTQLPAFKMHIQPLLDSFTIDSNTQPAVYRFLTYGFHKKAWFFIPCPFVELSANKIGTLVETDQGGLQTMDEIYFSADTHKGLDTSDSLAFAKMILHEGMMAIRLLQFESKRTQCLINSNINSYCTTDSKDRTGIASDLTPEEYPIIRDSVAGFLKMKTDSTWSDWEDFLARYFQVLDHRFISYAEQVTTSMDDVMQLYDKGAVTHSLPTIGYDTPWGQKPHFSISESCTVHLEKTNGGLYNLQVVRQSGEVLEYSFKGPEEQKLVPNFNEHTGEDELEVMVEPIKENVKKGDVVEFVYFAMDPALMQLNAVRISRLYCLSSTVKNNISTCGGKQGPFDLPDYLCSVK